ncbi:MAG: glycosyltransferase family 39 protein, partial [Anaerolineae bacterium]|nr:glycosyltransferase family 39 protein [Anaerolineae bacterium]
MSTDQRPRYDIPLLILTLLVALLLRTWQLETVPLGVDYDEAGNMVLAQEIATGQSRPIFIRAYAGREAVFYWLAALSLRLLGYNLFAFRLTSALCGVIAIAFAYLLARELFREEAPLIRQWVPLFGV